MTFSQILAGLVSAGNLYLGTRFLLNVVGLLQTTKYGPVATGIYAALFIGLGFGALYAAFWLDNGRLALLLSVGPWVIILAGLVISMIIGYNNG